MINSIKLFGLTCILVAVYFLSLTNFSRHPTDPDPDPVLPDTVVVVDTLIIVDTLHVHHDHLDTTHIHHDHPDTTHIHHDHTVHVHHDHPSSCDTVDIEIEFTVIGDQSAPNEYAYFLNGVEIGRFIITETYAEPTEITFRVTFERIIFGDVITIQKISGSRAAVIGSAIIGITCSG